MSWGEERNLLPTRLAPAAVDDSDDSDDPWLRGGGVRAQEVSCQLSWARADRCPLPWAQEIEA